MKLVEQYLHVVKSKLLLRGRPDIIKELRSLILDDIEAKFGATPSDEQVLEVLKSFGSPEEIAGKYKNTQPVISSELSPYFLTLIKLVLGALSIGFLVAEVVSFVEKPGSIQDIPVSLLQIAGNVLSGWLGAIGGITLMFIVASRYLKKIPEDFKENWHPEELKAVIIDEKQTTGKGEMFFISLFTIGVVILNIWPQIVVFVENRFFSTGLGAGIDHRINIVQFTFFIRVLTALWCAEVILGIVRLRRAASDTLSTTFMHVLNSAQLVVFLIMIFDKGLYVSYRGMVGLQLIIIIVATVEAAELLVALGKGIYRQVERKFAKG